jgi:hypothetical protein
MTIAAVAAAAAILAGATAAPATAFCELGAAIGIPCEEYFTGPHG